jgi:cell wall-associated NlpC family hydrolase
MTPAVTPAPPPALPPKPAVSKPIISTVSTAPVIASSGNNANIEIDPSKNMRQAIIKAARRYLNTPYRYGMPRRPVDDYQPTPKPSSMDCSGFIAQAYKDATGVTIPANSNAMWSQGKKVKASDVQPGDIVVISHGAGIDHVALYVDENTWMQSLNRGSKRGVVETTPDYDSRARVVGYATFVGTTSGNKAVYKPTSITPLTCTLGIDANTGSFGDMNIQSQIQLQFANVTGNFGLFKYYIYPEGQEKSSGASETFRLEIGQDDTSALLTFTVPGVYHICVELLGKVIFDKTINILK